MKTAGRYSLAVVLSVVLGWLALPVGEQTAFGANRWTQVRRDAARPLAEQRQVDVQRRLQGWFVTKITEFQNTFAKTSLGQAQPPVVFLGDFTPLLRRHLTPPTGTGAYHVVFDPDVGTAGVYETGARQVHYPQNDIDAYLDTAGRRNTCWHEFQHVIVIESQRAGRDVLVTLAPWRLWRKPPVDDIKEHVYIESLAEYTVQWLQKLLFVYKFEDHVREAKKTLRAYEARGVGPTYGIVHAAFAKARDAWLLSRRDMRQIPNRMSRALRLDYQAVTGGPGHGVWIGTIEDVVTFYMRTGVKAADGSRIRVPRWVMSFDDRKSGVICSHLNEKRTVAKNKLSYSFDVRLLDSYRHRAHGRCHLNTGEVTITLTPADPDATLQVSAGAKMQQPTQRNPIRYVVDLKGFKKDGSLHLTFLHNKLDSFAGTRRYTVTVSHHEVPRFVKGVQQPLLYHDSKAIYYIDVTGVRKPPAATPAPSTPSAPSSGQTTQAPAPGPGQASVGAAGGKGQWVLTGKRMTKKQNAFADTKFRIDLQPGGATASMTIKRKKPHPPHKQAFKATWTTPPTRLVPGQQLSVQITLADTGSSHTTAYWPRAVFGMSGVSVRPTLAVGVSAKKKEELPGADAATWTIPPPRPGYVGWDRIELSGSLRSFFLHPVIATYEYTWRPGKTPKKAVVATVTLEADEPKPPELPPELTDEPPKREVEKGPKKEKTGPTKPVKRKRRPAPAERYYTHPSGAYRFPLAAGWTVSVKHFFDDGDTGYDTVWPADKNAAVICTRDSTANGRGAPDPVLAAAGARIAKKNPGSTTTRTSMGAAPAVQVAAFDKEGVMRWHWVACHKGRTYHLVVCAPAQSADAGMPADAVKMLAASEWLR